VWRKRTTSPRHRISRRPGRANRTERSAGQAAPAQGKRPPQAKTQPEFEAYNAAKALTDAAAQEKAADDFAASSRTAKYARCSTKRRCRSINRPTTATDARYVAQVLAIDADDPEALLGVAQVLAERTRDTDLDKDQKLAELKKTPSGR